MLYQSTLFFGNAGLYDYVHVYDLETGELGKTDLGAVNGYEIERPVFSSNGNRLIFSAERGVETGRYTSTILKLVKWKPWLNPMKTSVIPAIHRMTRQGGWRVKLSPCR